MTDQETKSTVHVYLSPHIDDAALSCGGTIWQQTQAGQPVLVVNVFAGIPDYSRLSAFAREKHAVWGESEDAVATRRAEDGAALALLGADVVYWSYLDAIYRYDGDRVLYPDVASIFGDVDPAEDELLAQLVEEVDAQLDEVGATTCYAPLAIGHHVDHLIVRDVGLALAGRGRRLRFCEDFPYVWWATHRDVSGDVDWAVVDDTILAPEKPLPSGLEALGRWESHVHRIDVERKIAAVACYASQILDLFGSRDAMAEAVREYARFVGEGRYAERLWEINSDTTARTF